MGKSQNLKAGGCPTLCSQLNVSYTYWPTLPDHAATVLSEMGADHPEIGAIIDHKNREHARIQALASMPDGADIYFKNVPHGCSYSFLAGYVK